MRRMLTVVGCGVLVLFLRAVPRGLADAQPARPAAASDGANKVVRSTEVVVRDVAYCIERKEGVLHFVAQRIRGAAAATSDEELKLPLKEADEIVEAALAPLSTKHLVAIVKVRRGHEYNFYCVTFTWFRDDSEILNG